MRGERVGMSLPKAADLLHANGTLRANVSDAIFANFKLLNSTSKSLDAYFVVHAAALVFFMQAGFAMLTAGSVRSKNTKNVLLKNLLDACACSLAYWLFGFAFAFGEANNLSPGVHHPFIGIGPFALAGKNKDLHDFVFQLAFAATATTIVSGAVAERTSFYAYLAYAFFLSAFVYPVVAHWIWAGGFLANLISPGRGVLDFAGCAVVHTVGGFAGLVGAIIVGPRLGRFDSEGQPIMIPGHSASIATIGTFFLWFGWYGFNPGSALRLSGGLYLTAERCAVTTTLAAASAGIVTLFVLRFRDHYFDLLSALNGILAGLVSITASCGFVHPYAAVIIGSVGALVYIGTVKLLLRFRIDDPLEAFPIHGACGVWGLIATGLFSVRRFVEISRKEEGQPVLFGAFYGGGGKLLGANIAGALIVIVWTSTLIGALFLGMKRLKILRISPEEELIGNDVCKHGGAAYHVEAVEEAERKAVRNLQMEGELLHGGHVDGERNLPEVGLPHVRSNEFHKGSTDTGSL